jgi:hypothetical protein
MGTVAVVQKRGFMGTIKDTIQESSRDTVKPLAKLVTHVVLYAIGAILIYLVGTAFGLFMAWIRRYETGVVAIYVGESLHEGLFIFDFLWFWYLVFQSAKQLRKELRHE